VSFEDRFCSSLWFHQRITNDGTYVPCRWQKTKLDRKRPNISNTTPEDHFQGEIMSKWRKDMIDGVYLEECKPCYEMEKYNKISGRQKQLLKTGIEIETINNDIQTSPYYEEFVKTSNDYPCELYPVDLQVDLGNYCNGKCLFCIPEYSSSLASEFKKIGLINDLPPTSWSRSPELINKFVTSLQKTKNLKYVHFLGGETLIDPAFKYVLEGMLESNLTDVSIGFTTNLTVWSEDVINLLLKFKEINLGLSIETLHPVNDYARYPSKQKETREILDRWVELASKNNWLLQLRITPTWLTIESVHTIYEYALKHNITVESCNFLHRPDFMRMNILPDYLRERAIKNLEEFLQNRKPKNSHTVNIRNKDMIVDSIIEDANSYLTYLKEAPYEQELIPHMIDYIKKIEKHRKNSVLDYLPHYEEFLRSHGY